MALGVEDGAGPDSEASAASLPEGSQVVVDVVSLKTFLAALQEAAPARGRHLRLIRTAPPEAE